ncbi:HNH endonuclease [Telluribacter sp.]|jgi:putative restriction endonuclease|uniref:HNH endonuclease n=1 Tax=Telluribacter sp. TaxID=1978767 RepID=UPI002E118C8F|nr:HNH endonuclease [Telluribacter sp.]
MPDHILDYFQYTFSHLNTGGGRTKEMAPHKPILLLSVIQAYENKILTSNQIPISPELTNLFRSNWNLFVTTNHTPGFALPFFHLKNEKGNWWELVANPGCEMWVQNGKLSSFSSLSAAVAYAQIDPKLAHLLQNEVTRQVLRQVLLSTYFPGRAMETARADTHLDELKREMLEESPSEYRAKLKSLKTRLDPETYQIEIYARNTLFRREITRIYDDTCCITGVRVAAHYSFSMVDACHIVPFYKTYNNHPTNGIALCPNLHRAFDKGAISIDTKYRVMVSPTFVENEKSTYSLKSVAGKQIELPKEERYLPDPEALDWHRNSIFKG